MIDKAKFLFKAPKLSALSFLRNEDILDDSKTEYFWTRNPDDLRQYTKLIDMTFDSELNLKDVYKKIDAKDLRSFFYIGKCNNEVVAGVRLTINDPISQNSLPTEREGFSFNQLFPELHLDTTSYCEVSRYAALPSHRRNMEHYRSAYGAYRDVMTQHNVKYLFICSSRARFKIYNREAKKYFNILDVRHFDVSDWDDYKDLEFYVCAYENPLV